jgi:hypothetical protein
MNARGVDVGATRGPRARIVGGSRPVPKCVGFAAPRGRNTPDLGLVGAEILGFLAPSGRLCGIFCDPGEGNAAWPPSGRAPQSRVWLGTTVGVVTPPVH